MRVMPHVLKELIRHESIEATMKYCVGRNSESITKTLRQTVNSETGNSFGNVSAPPATHRS